MKTINSLFIELLRISLGTQSELSKIPSPEDWKNIMVLAKRHGVLGIMFSGIELLGQKSAIPKNILLQWCGIAINIESQNELLDRRTRELTSIFLEYGFRSCILKGQGNALLYPNPRRRCGGDIDLWLEGKRNDILKFLRQKWIIGDVLMYHADVKVFDDAAVEIHYLPAFSYNPFRDYKYRKFFKQEGQLQFRQFDDSVGFAHPSLYFNAVYSLIHIFNHSLKNEILFKQIIDYYYILKHLQASDRIQIMKTIKWIGLERFAGGLMYVIQSLLLLTDESKDYLLCPANEKAGKLLIDDLFLSQKRTSNQALLKHLRLYPSEVLWAPVWKAWHWCWRKIHN